MRTHNFHSIPHSFAHHSASASERKRRQVYRGEVHGQLPFETRGMDDAVPSIDFSPSGTSDAPYSLERNDVDGNAPHTLHTGM